ncbi:O-antigen ligase family protein [Deltaproteobacteria bacterium TL4]
MIALLRSEKLVSASQFFVYVLFITSAFTIAGMGAASILMSLLLFARAMAKPELLYFNVPAFKPLLFLFIGAVISALLSSDPLNNLTQVRDFWRFLLPFVVWKSFEGVSHKKLLILFLSILAIASVYGMIQYYYGVDWFRAEGHKKITPYIPEDTHTGRFHAKGNFSHHLTFANYLLLVFPLYLSVGISRLYSLRFRITMSLGALMILIALVLTLGRSAWIGSIIGVGILLLRLPKKWLLAMMIVLILGGSALVFHFNPGSSFKNPGSALDSGLKTRFDSIFVLHLNWDRFALWDTALLAIKDHPWFGIGWENNEQVMPHYRSLVIDQCQGVILRIFTEECFPGFLNPSSAGVHNIYLQIGVYLGTIGIIGFLWFYGSLLWWNYKWIRRAQQHCPLESTLLWGIQAGIAGFMVAGFFENNWLDGETQTLFFALMGWSLYLGKQIEKRLQLLKG